MEPISANLATVSGRIEAAARAAGRSADAVTLIAVSKTQPADSVRAALAACAARGEAAAGGGGAGGAEPQPASSNERLAANAANSG